MSQIAYITSINSKKYFFQFQRKLNLKIAYLA
jgi:hypothetical protein